MAGSNIEESVISRDDLLKIRASARLGTNQRKGGLQGAAFLSTVGLQYPGRTLG